MIQFRKAKAISWLIFGIGLLITAIVYWPGLSGSWLFDDYANIVDNKGVQPSSISLGSIVSAMLSSPASEFKRPLASLSFSINYLISGLAPFGWKLVNLTIHLLNGALIFVLARLFIDQASNSITLGAKQRDMTSALLAIGWMLLPINVTAVLYVVQREESLANLFVLIGLIGYTYGRSRMLAHGSRLNFYLCVLSLIVPTVIGLGAKETTITLPLYAAMTEWLIFGFRKASSFSPPGTGVSKSYDSRLFILFLFLLVIPGLLGLAWILPRVLGSSAWVARNFTLETRLLSEMRIVCDYLHWILLPSPQSLSFYHDDFVASTSIFTPWTTLASAIALIALIVAMFMLRHRFVLASLGIAFFLGGQLLTATILPLELVFEHRNYFASFGILLAVLPPLLSPQSITATKPNSYVKITKLCYMLAGILFLNWIVQTATTAYAWGNPLRLSEELASRAPTSPRAQYELGRTYVIMSRYDSTSPFTRLAHEALERAAALPGSTILPEQGLIFMNSRMHLPLEDRWWHSMIAKLKLRRSAVEDESAIEQLSTCQTNGQCDLPKQKMLEVYLAALSHPNPGARLLNMYGMYAWEELYDHTLGIRMLQEAVASNPKEPAYRVTLVRMLTDTGRLDEARRALNELAPLNLAGHMNDGIATLSAGIAAKEKASTTQPARSTSG